MFMLWSLMLKLKKRLIIIKIELKKDHPERNEGREMDDIP